MRRGDKIAFAIFILFAIGVMTVLGVRISRESAACDARGGILVNKASFGYACVKEITP
jgi:hypothetical protein